MGLRVLYRIFTFMDVSKPYTKTTKESRRNFERGWDLIFKTKKNANQDRKKVKKNGSQKRVKGKTS